MRKALLVTLGVAVAGAVVLGIGVGPRLRELGDQGVAALAAVRQDLSDARCTARVRTSLALDRRLRGQEIDVSTGQGVVRLQGRADSRETLEVAARVAAGVPGVAAVANDLVVDPPDPRRGVSAAAADRMAEASAHVALGLRRDLAGTDLDVRAAGGEMVVAGHVDDPAQRAAALEVVRNLPQAMVVRDDVRVCAPAEGRSVPGAAEAVRRALAHSPHLAPYGLVVDGGPPLRLRGTVAAAIERDLAGSLARESAGSAVLNEIEVVSGP